MAVRTDVSASSLRTTLWAGFLTVLFVATRYLNHLLSSHQDADFVKNDVSYYGYWTWCLLGDGVAARSEKCLAAVASGQPIMAEYPVPATWILQFLYTIGGTPTHPWAVSAVLAVVVVSLALAIYLSWCNRPRLGLGIAAVLIVAALAWWFLDCLPNRAGGEGFHAAFFTWTPYYVVAMLLVDGIVAVLLFKPDNPWGCFFWIAFIALCGAITYYRFDILTAALVALACLWLVQRPAVAGALVGLGAAIKLWPALLALPMAAWHPLRKTLGRRRSVGFLVVGVGLGLASLVAAGWSRSASPLGWQSMRGLQMESVPATAIMFLRTFTDLSHWSVSLSEYNAIELFGPHVGWMLTLSTVLTAGSLLLTVALTWRMCRHHRLDDSRLTEAIMLSILAVVLATMIANKTLSTQYVQWLGGPVAALILVRTSAWLRRHLHVIVALTLLVAGLTQLTYPWLTYQIMGNGTNSDGFGGGIIILRNLLLVALTIHVAALAWRASGAATAISHVGADDAELGKLPGEGIAA